MKCDACGSENIREEILLCRGMVMGDFRQWMKITRRCHNCGAIKAYREETKYMPTLES